MIDHVTALERLADDPNVSATMRVAAARYADLLQHPATPTEEQKK